MSRPDCSVVIVSWNVRELLVRCIRSILASCADSAWNVTITVVDNASSDGSAALVREAFPMVEVVETGANLGYAGGVNVGLQHATGRWVLVLNPDTEMVDRAIPTLLEWAAAHLRVVVVGPQLRYADGSLQSSRRRWPTPLTFFAESTLVERWWPASPWIKRYRMEAVSPAEPQHVDWLVGAALLVRRDAIEQVGGMDERYWMYSEELEWQWRLAQVGAIWYNPNASIIHHEGQSSAQVPARKHIAFQRSKLRYAAQRHGPLLATVLHCFLIINYAFDWLVEAFKWLIGHKRPLRRDRMQVYAAVLNALVSNQ